jgi:hypothetical protein
MCLADPWWSDEQHVGGGLEIAAGAELGDELAVQSGGGVEVEVLQGGWGGRQANRNRPARRRASVASTSIDTSCSSAAVIEVPSA